MSVHPPPQCFSCGKNFPESDFEEFHQLTETFTNEGTLLEGRLVKLSYEAAQKYILDGKLSQKYPKICCRAMFLGDDYEYRKKAALYDLTKIEEHVKFY